MLQELERISERGGVLGAMETGYQRGRIQDESMLYEQRKHDGTLPIVGVNTFLDPNGHDEAPRTPELQRSTDEEKQSQITRLRDFQDAPRRRAPRRARAAPRRPPSPATTSSPCSWTPCGSCSLGEITHTLFEVGGRYRRNV